MQSRSGSEPREEELAALADGTLAPERRAEVEALAASTPELAERLEEQRTALAHLQSAAEQVDAPTGLRYRLEASKQPVMRSPFHWIGLGLGAAAAVALVVVLLLPQSLGGPSVAQAAALATRGPSAPAPGVRSATLLAKDVQGVAFPNWAEKFGWKPVGVRTDRIRGRRMVTVFYEKAGKRIGYTIVEGKKLKWPPARIVQRGPTNFHLVVINGRPVVTWLRHGHTCVLSGDIPFAKLVKLADWRGKGTVTF
jgi:hypothetical protein